MGERLIGGISFYNGRAAEFTECEMVVALQRAICQFEGKGSCMRGVSHKAKKYGQS